MFCRRLAGLVCLGALVIGLPAPSLAAVVLQAEQDARQSYEEARQALLAGRLDEAELLLERVLMLMPEHAEARLEFALLMARRGQPEAARALILDLARDPRTPAQTRAQLQALARQLPPGGPAAHGAAVQDASGATASELTAHVSHRPFRWRAEALLATSTNPLARTGAQDVVLTLPDGPLALPLNARPQAGTVAGGVLQWTQGASGLEASAQRMDSEDTATAFRVQAWGEWVWPSQFTPLPVLQWQWQTTKGFDDLHRHGATLAAPLRSGHQRLVLGTYLEPAQEDRGWLLRLEHRAVNSPGLMWLASAERSASAVREQGYWRLNLALEAALGPGRRLQAQASAQEDTHPYSPLLASNSTRRLWTTHLGFEQQVPLGLGSMVLLRAFATQRNSNLELFKFRDISAQLALARQW